MHITYRHVKIWSKEVNHIQRWNVWLYQVKQDSDQNILVDNGSDG